MISALLVGALLLGLTESVTAEVPVAVRLKDSPSPKGEPTQHKQFLAPQGPDRLRQSKRDAAGLLTQKGAQRLLTTPSPLTVNRSLRRISPLCAKYNVPRKVPMRVRGSVAGDPARRAAVALNYEERERRRHAIPLLYNRGDRIVLQFSLQGRFPIILITVGKSRG